MFYKKKENTLQGEQKAGSVNIVDVGTEITGDLTTKGDIRVDGKITGDVNSKAKVVVGATGIITGHIFSNTAEISGEVNGNIDTLEILFLKASAKVNGNIASNQLVIENGAHFTGYCQTGLSQTKSISLKDVSGSQQSTEKEAIA
jgi:cytoskeletal protein CcmA (bactofilin family)